MFRSKTSVVWHVMLVTIVAFVLGMLHSANSIAQTCGTDFTIKDGETLACQLRFGSASDPPVTNCCSEPVL